MSLGRISWAWSTTQFQNSFCQILFTVLIKQKINGSICFLLEIGIDTDFEWCALTASYSFKKWRGDLIKNDTPSLLGLVDMPDASPLPASLCS